MAEGKRGKKKGERGQGIWYKGREGRGDRGRIVIEGDVVEEKQGKISEGRKECRVGREREDLEWNSVEGRGGKEKGKKERWKRRGTREEEERGKEKGVWIGYRV
jgi:hypothetical protein